MSRCFWPPHVYGVLQVCHLVFQNDVVRVRKDLKAILFLIPQEFGNVFRLILVQI